MSAAPAAAQVAVTVGFESDYRYRSRSLSDGNPVASATLSYDHPTGFYAAGSLVAVLDSDPGLLAVQGNAGYARRVGSGIVVDLGVLHTEYTDRFSSGFSTDLTQYYAGASKGNFTGRVYYSPDYFGSGLRTLYSEVEAVADLGSDLRLNGHVGLLQYLDSSPGDDTRYDWALALSRQLGTSEAHVVLSGGGPRQYYQPYGGDRTALVVGVSHAF